MVRCTLGVTRKDKIRNKYVRDRENCKARRQTSGRKATLELSLEKERRRLRGK